MLDEVLDAIGSWGFEKGYKGLQKATFPSDSMFKALATGLKKLTKLDKTRQILCTDLYGESYCFEGKFKGNENLVLSNFNASGL